MIDIEAFLLGMKPALYGNTSSPTTMKYIEQLKIYPYISENIAIFDGEDFFLFFQTDKRKEDFLAKMNRVKPRTPEFNELLGNTLGYPPLASRFYAKCIKPKQTGNIEVYQQFCQFRVSIRYAGIRCTSHVDDLMENVTWLWDHYEDEEDLKVLIDTTYYTVKRNDMIQLRELTQLKLERVEHKLGVAKIL